MASLNEDKKNLIRIFEKRFGSQLVDAFKKVKRENFVLKEYKENSYHDEALPIISGQTISQPSTIMVMLKMLELEKGQKVLEIGAGSGYNAALISCIIGSKGIVYSIEFLNDVGNFALKNVKKSKIKNIMIINADGSLGYLKEAPYDRIIVTAACPDILDAWISQLKINGIIVAPVGSGYQRMVKIVKRKDRLERTDSSTEYVFVPLKGRYGF